MRGHSHAAGEAEGFVLVQQQLHEELSASFENVAARGGAVLDLDAELAAQKFQIALKGARRGVS